jgi:hypothetical protein
MFDWDFTRQGITQLFISLCAHQSKERRINYMNEIFADIILNLLDAQTSDKFAERLRGLYRVKSLRH